MNNIPPQYQSGYAPVNNNISPPTFAFNLGQVNQIKPKQLRKLDIIHLIRTNNIPELKAALYDLSQENFAENDYFEFNKDELKLVKVCQMMMQYMMHSINALENKNQLINDFINQQIEYNEAAEQVLEKQIKKMKSQEDEINKITGNCENMEFLIKQMNLEENAKELGIKLNDYNSMSREEANKLREAMVNQSQNQNNE